MTGHIDIISASAGSGKTTRLARELEKAITVDGIAPDRIVATTFTRKAAAELVERGRQTLLRAGRPDDAELFRAARIGTVNAVAGMLVSDFAFEAGISPELTVLDEARAQEAFRRSLGEVVTEDDLADIGRLASRFDDFPWQEVVRQIADAARTNHIGMDALDSAQEVSIHGFFELLDSPRPADEIDTRLDVALAGAIDSIRSLVENGADKTKRSAETLDAYQRALHRMRASHTLPWPDWVGLAGRGAAVKTDPLCEPVRRAASALLAHSRFRDDCELAIRICFGLAQRALAAYRRYKTERRAIDFVDQETIALELLERPDVREALATEISLVLVDELQDVSPLQLALFLALARIAPRSVWVGDQKQAIYGFRGADPSLMEAVVGEVLRGAEPEALAVGRRSRAALVDLTNALFVPPFRDVGLPAGRVSLEPATREEPPGLGPCLERWRLDAKNVAEAGAALASCVHDLLSDPTVQVRDRVDGTARAVRPSDVAILCRRRNTGLEVAECLSRVGVPSEIARFGLLATLEGRVVSAGLRLWVDPADMLARAELAKIVAPELADIDVLVRGDDTSRWRDVQPIATLVAARDAAPLAGSLDAFDTLVEALELEDLLARAGRGRQGIANLDALRAHAVDFVRVARHHGGASSPAALVAHLHALAADTDDAQALGGSGDAVNITTWHAAKGLEWPIVVLYEIDGGFSRNALGVHAEARRDGPLRLDAPLEGRTIRYWPSPFHPSTTQSPFHERLAHHPISAAANDAGVREEVRLLYVGWTRARDRLVLASRRDLASGTLRLFGRGGGSVPTEPPLPESERDETVVQWGGRDVAILLRRPPRHATGALPIPTAADIHVRPAPRDYPPARARPSDVERTGTIVRTERLGPSIALAVEDADPIALGTAVHAFLAADRPDLDDDDRAELGMRLLTAWGIERALPLFDLLQMGLRLRQWIAAKWPAGRVHREWPIEHRLPAGTIVRGAADLVVETAASIAIIDHKVIAATDERVLSEAAGYAGQLDAYAAALVAAGTARPVETMVHLPLSGLVVRVQTARTDP